MSDSTIFVASDAFGVFRSTNNGKSWADANSGFDSYSIIDAIVMNGNSIFAGAKYGAGGYGGGIFRSNDNGASWIWIPFYLPSGGKLCVWAIITQGTNLYAGTNNGVYVSTNNGAGWISVDTGFTQNVGSLAMNDSCIFAGTDKGIYRAFLNRISWEGVSLIPNAILVASNNTLFTGTSNGVLLSKDNGTTWEVINTGLTDSTITALSVSGNNLFAGTSIGVFRSTIDGKSWTACNTGLTNLHVLTLALRRNNIFAGTAGGVFFSSDTAITWTAINSGLFKVIALYGMGNTIFAGTQQGGIFRSTDNGAKWTSFTIGAGGSIPAVKCFGILGNNLFAGTSNGVFVYDSSSASWSCPDSGFHRNASCLASSGNNLLIGEITYNYGSGGGDYTLAAYLSRDSGKSWSGVLSNKEANSFALATYDNNCYGITTSFYYDHGSKSSNVYYSADNGSTWTNIASFSFMQLTTIAACNNYLYAGTIHAYPSDPPNIICLNCPHIGEGVLLSIDNGKNWNPINSGLPDSIDVLSFAVSGGTIFAATSRGVFFLPPNGIQWVAFNDGLPSLNVSALAVNDKNLFAAITGGIVWQRPIADVTAEKELKIYHNQFEFKLILSNGSNPKVSVIFFLQYSERIEITAYNLLGSKIATLVEKRFNKGQHCVSFNVSGLVSGCYTIKLKTETSIATKKMLLMQ